ncbi:ROK family protein [Candidatus Woesearchaeota archaeon]|nr:ROK family protein [Candidatus Woesearchaeota archaeon]
MGGEYCVGIDVGGTKIEGVLIDAEGVVHKRRRIPTAASDGVEAVLGRIEALITKLTRRRALKVGISFPGYLDDAGLLRSCPHLPGFEGEPLEELLRKHVKHPCVVENDANCFALAEQRAGAGEGCEHVIGLIIGTGIGMGVVIDGKVYKGRGGAGDIGHVRYQGVEVEDYAAGPGILRRYYRHGGDQSQVERVFDKKTLVAAKTVRETVDALAWLLDIIVRAYDPEIIVVGGGVSNAPILQALNAELRGSCRVVRNKLGDGSGSLGAAFLAQEKV